jgi:hypothetical protein
MSAVTLIGGAKAFPVVTSPRVARYAPVVKSIARYADRDGDEFGATAATNAVGGRLPAGKENGTNPLDRGAAR